MGWIGKVRDKKWKVAMSEESLVKVTSGPERGPAGERPQRGEPGSGWCTVQRPAQRRNPQRRCLPAGLKSKLQVQRKDIEKEEKPQT